MLRWGKSVLFYSSINLSYEQVCGVEANGACQKPKAQNSQECVAKVQHGWNEVFNVQLLHTHIEEKTDVNIKKQRSL